MNHLSSINSYFEPQASISNYPKFMELNLSHDLLLTSFFIQASKDLSAFSRSVPSIIAGA